MRGLGLVAPVLALVAVMVYGTVQSNRPLPPQPLPSPNGYDDFLEAGQLVVGNPEAYTSTSPEKLRELLATNAEALKLVKQGLTRSCRARTDFSVGNFSIHMNELARFKLLVHLLVAEGRLAEMEHRTNDAMQSYLDAVRFGQEACRGGLVIDKLVGIACQANGIQSLQKIVAGLDASQCRVAIQALEKALTDGESRGEIMNHERRWSRANTRFLDLIRVRMATRSLNPMKQTEKQLTVKMRHSEVVIKRVMIDLAGRAYQVELGKPPGNLADLVPAYLPAMPIDPVTGTKLNYLPILTGPR